MTSGTETRVKSDRTSKKESQEKVEDLHNLTKKKIL